MDVSIILANWNVKDLMRGALRSVYEQTRDISYEVIVVDDGSTDGSVEMLRAEFPSVIIIENKKNVGFSKANNQAAAIAKGRYVFLLNTDTLLVDNVIKTFVDYLEAHQEVGVCGGWLKNADGTSQVSFGSFPSFTQAIADAFYLNDMFPKAHFPRRGVLPDGSIIAPKEVDYVTGAAILIRNELIEQLGLFDEFYHAYSEETDFCYRVKHTVHKKIMFLPSASVTHFGGFSYRNVRKFQIQLMCSSTHKFLTKYHGQIYSFITRLLYAWHYGVKIPVRFVRYLIASPAIKEEKRKYLLHAWYEVRYILAPNEEFTGS